MGHGLSHNFLLTSLPFAASVHTLSLFFTTALQKLLEEQGTTADGSHESQRSTGEVTLKTSLKHHLPTLLLCTSSNSSKWRKLLVVLTAARTPKRCLSIVSVSHCFSHSKKVNQHPKANSPWRPSSTGK